MIRTKAQQAKDEAALEAAKDLNAERDSEVEQSELLKAWKEKDKVERARFEDSVTGDYYVVVVFQTPDHKYEFLKHVDLWAEEGFYLNGFDVARAVGLQLQGEVPEPSRRKGTARDLL